MSRAIEIIDTSGFYWAVSIDGNVIHLGKRLCRVDFGNADNLNSVLKDIEDVFIWRHTFSDVQSRTNTFNLLILLDSIYYESTSELFQYHCAEIMKQCDTPFAETFTKVFGSCPEKKYRRLSIVSEISKIYKDIHFQFYGPLKLKRSKYASSSQFCVKYTSSIGNVISYTLNDEPLDICLRGKTHLAEATNVLSVIENLQEALASEDRTTVLAIFEEVGYLNALDIIRICYPKLAICFFTRIAERMVHTRQRVYPFLLLKNYIKTVPYQGNARKFFYALLEQLEDRVPYYEEQLIAGNEQEMLSDKGTYTLYFRNANTLYSTELVFIGGFQLRKECKEFCLNYAKFGSKNLNIEKASLVSGIFRQLFSIMFNDLDIYIESIVSLTSSDVKILLSYLIQSSEFAYTTIKKRILLLGKFYAYITGIEPTNPASAFYKLKPQYQGYLFVHPKLPRIITTNDFNDYLSKLCTSNNIVDSDGNATKITSHDLRHINVCERLQGNIISATETMVECNHSSLDQTLGYGYPAKKDEAKHLADITKQIPLFGEQKKVTCLQVPSFKYSRLLDEPNTRIIPGYGICRNDNCKPQFEKCIACESFSPDPACRDFFSAAIDLLSKRNQQIIKRHGDSKVLTHNEEMIRLYKKCLARIESNLS